MNHNKNNSNEIASKELNLNIVNQKIQVKDFKTIGCEWDEGIFVFMLMIPKKMLGFKIKSGRME